MMLLVVLLYMFEVGLLSKLAWFKMFLLRLLICFCLFGVVFGSLFIYIWMLWMLKVEWVLKFCIDNWRFCVKLLGLRISRLGSWLSVGVNDKCCCLFC